MRIAAFWARGYRSLRDVRLDDLRAFNVFYGPNGSGKSNVLSAIDALMRLARTRAKYGVQGDDSAGSEATRRDLPNTILRDDLCAHADERTIVLGATVMEAGEGTIPLGPSFKLPSLTFEVTLDWIVESQPRLAWSWLRSGETNLLSLKEGDVAPAAFCVGKPKSVQELQRHLQELLVRLPDECFALVGADRFPHPEIYDQRFSELTEALRADRVKHALFMASTSPKPAVRQRLAVLKEMLEGEPLRRPPFDAVLDTASSNKLEIRERLPGPDGTWRDIPLEHAGLGVAQIYYTLAKAVLIGARSLGMEEPEAHLHAPTSGRHLRQLLERLVKEHHVEQFFIATHSNLFDLDPERYFDVRLGADGCTVVEAKQDLMEIDRLHLYEPGPAKHALLVMLGYMPPDEVVFRRADGTGVAAKEMIGLLQADDDLALTFLQDVHGAAVRVVRLKAQRGGTA